jgi:hypothetical protein
MQSARTGFVTPPRLLSAAEAQAIAERAHGGQVEPSGRPYLEHVRRVAAAVPAEAKSVAWLHDVLEWTDLDEPDLAAAGLAPQECAALRLLTRPDEPDDESFLSHVRVIALTAGPEGDLARVVKRADMKDRLRLPRDPGAPWRPPYRRALEVLANADRGTHTSAARRVCATGSLGGLCAARGITGTDAALASSPDDSKGVST